MEILTNRPLANITTLRVGGPAAFFAIIKNKEDARKACRFAREHHIPFRVIGGGSNIIVPDDGYRGLIIKNEIQGIAYSNDTEQTIDVTVGSGVLWDELVRETIQKNFYGFENLSGIPGTVGGTPVQNVGAYGVEVSEYIQSVFVYDAKSDTFRVITRDACEFGYRTSIFKTPEGALFIILSVTYRLKKHAPLRLAYTDIKNRIHDLPLHEITLQYVRTIILEIRNEKFPDLSNTGTAGSFFKNLILPVEDVSRLSRIFPDLPAFNTDTPMIKVPLGWLLERLGLKGMRRGKVRLFEKHALVLVADIGATASEIHMFAKDIENIVFQKTNLRIEREVITIE